MSISKTRKQWLSCSMPSHSSMNEYSLEILIFSLARFFRSKSHSRQIYSCELPSRATEIFRCSFQPHLCRHACLKYLSRRNSELHFYLKEKTKNQRTYIVKWWYEQSETTSSAAVFRERSRWGLFKRIAFESFRRRFARGASIKKRKKWRTTQNHPLGRVTVSR